MGDYFHWLHHKYFEGNYGETTIPLDKWFGTFREGPSDGSEAAPLPTERHYQLAAKTPSNSRKSLPDRLMVPGGAPQMQ